MDSLSQLIENLRSNKVKIVYNCEVGPELAKVLVELFDNTIFKLPFKTGIKLYNTIQHLTGWELFYAFGCHLISISFQADVPVSKQYSTYEVIFKPYASSNNENTYVSIGRFSASPISDTRLLLIEGLSFGSD
jgi:hypothetical protein